MRSTIIEKQPAKNINSVTVFFMALFHVGAIAALFTFNWQAFAAAVLLWWMSGSLGIGLGYHRLLTHRGFKVPKWLEYFLTICGALALQGGPIFWVGLHRIHHARSDKEGDPHSPREGFFWSHVGWILYGEGQHNDAEKLSRYAPDLAKDKFHVWLSKYHYVPQIVTGLILLAIGGVPMVLWGVFFRTTIGLHITWLVNSATHVWGYQRFKSGDDSRNNWWVALMSFGEGWHNNHHAHAASARHGLAWYEIDLNWVAIWILRLVGLAKDVRVVSLDTAPRKIEEDFDAALQSAS